ncbi:MAG TPA: hemolysin III family protein, partial [Deinococcales bacterium]|nr:hemolysin III family protein [Deinococcales bacterium]
MSTRAARARPRLREPVSSLTHLAGALAAAAFTGPLVVAAARAGLQWPAFLVFGLSMVLLYTASATYHAVRVPPAALAWFRKADHAAIFLLIAGTYTPVLAVGLDGPLREWALAVIWGIAALGLVLKLATLRGPRWLSVALYLAMGWLSVILLPQLAGALNPSAMRALALGGAFYTVGAIIYATKRCNP